MNNTILAAVLMMVGALPAMFLVIGIFIFATKLLVNSFPPEDEDDDGDDD